MALPVALLSGAAVGVIGYKTASGRPAPRRRDPTEGVHEQKPAYWRNWVGNTDYDVREDAYRTTSMAGLQTAWPMQLEDGNWLPPEDNGSGVNPAVGTIVRHTGRTWRQTQLSAPAPDSRVTRAKRAPLPTQRQGMITM